MDAHTASKRTLARALSCHYCRANLINQSDTDIALLPMGFWGPIGAPKFHSAPRPGPSSTPIKCDGPLPICARFPPTIGWLAIVHTGQVWLPHGPQLVVYWLAFTGSPPRSCIHWPESINSTGRMPPDSCPDRLVLRLPRRPIKRQARNRVLACARARCAGGGSTASAAARALSPGTLLTPPVQLPPRWPASDDRHRCVLRARGPLSCSVPDALWASGMHACRRQPPHRRECWSPATPSTPADSHPTHRPHRRRPPPCLTPRKFISPPLFPPPFCPPPPPVPGGRGIPDHHLRLESCPTLTPTPLPLPATTLPAPQHHQQHPPRAPPFSRLLPRRHPPNRLLIDRPPPRPFPSWPRTSPPSCTQEPPAGGP